MCIGAVGMAVAKFALSAASSMAGFAQQQQQFEAQQQHYENNRIASNAAAVDKYTSIQTRSLQEQKAASQEQQQLETQGIKARATAQTAAGEAGVTGLSVDSLVADYYGEEGRYTRTLANNLQMQEDYLRGEMDATEAQATSRINSVQQGTPPSFAGAAIRIFGGALNAFGSYRQNTRT